MTSMLGTKVLRVEDPAFLTTGATYTEDLVDDRLVGALHATFVRAPIAHARIESIDTQAALAAPGVVAVYTAADLDLPPASQILPMLPNPMAQPNLAADVVRFVGEAVAVVLTETRYQGEDAAELVEIDYEPLHAVVSAREAAADETLLFPEFGTNVATRNEGEFSDDFFDGCEVVVTAEIVNQRMAVAPLEGRAAAAVWGSDGRATVWCSNQGAQYTKMVLAIGLGIDPTQLRVITPDVGGGFGAKFGADPEHVVLAWAARKTARPVRWTETRSDNMLAMTHGRGQANTVTLGGTRDGRMIAYRLDVLQDCGGYARTAAFLPTFTLLMTPGVYAFDRIEARAISVVTNTTPVGAIRGAGRPEATHAVERAVDLFAAEIGMDPADVRRRNVLPKFTEPVTTGTGASYDCGDYPASLELALESAGYTELRREQAQRRARGDTLALGIGMSSYVEITGGAEPNPPTEAATVEVHPDGSATVLTGTSPHGQGHQTVWATLASEELGIPIEKITLKWGDTDLVPEGGGTGASRSLQLGGAAVAKASQELVELAKQRAADLLEVDAADLVLDTARAGLTVAGVPDTAISFADLAAEERLFVQTKFSAPGPTFPFGTHVAVVEVDLETGKVTLQRLVAVDDAGVIINPLLADGQVHGGISMGVAQALLEEVLYDPDGNPITSTFADYGIITAPELPDFELVPMVTPTPYNPLGAKGIGESGTVGAAPAVQNAVIDALSDLGIRHIDMPATPLRVWRAVQEASN